jgi:segregation and condensation protein B
MSGPPNGTTNTNAATEGHPPSESPVTDRFVPQAEESGSPKEPADVNKEESERSKAKNQNYPKENGNTHNDGDNSEPDLEMNAPDQVMNTETHLAEEDNGNEAADEKQLGEVSSAAEPVVNSLDGLAEIVNLSDASENNEASSREETIDELAHIIEAIIFASDEPLSVGTIKSVLDAAHMFGRLNPDMIISRINVLNDKYDYEGSGFHIIEIAEGYQFATRKELAQWVSYLFKEKARRKLSNSALETLAIIAYKQPITKPEIESIRGVNVDYVLHNLLEKEIVTVIGRAETVGRPLLYGTTQRFLKIFGLKNLEDLPKLREIEEIIKEIRSKGAEESIQLEITALGDPAATEAMRSDDSRADTLSKD